jgi:hypothetical protein
MGINPPSKPRSSNITADFFTSTHRFSACVMVGNRRLTDILNDRTTDYLEVHDVYVSRIDKPGEILGTYKLASLIKRYITFIIIPDEGNQFQDRAYPSFSKRIEDVFLSVPSFEIHGKLEITGKLDLKAILAIGTTTFIPIIEGNAVHTHHPDISFSGPTLLANKVGIQFFSVVGANP